MPQVPIADPPEVRVLLGYLARVRAGVVDATTGLDDDTVRRPGVPSGTNLLGLVQHLAGVERHWLQRVFLGEDVAEDKGMQVAPERTVDEVIADYRAACARTDEIVHATGDLSTPAAIPNPGEEQRDSLRIIVTHLIEETARHAGHADVLREQIDGRTNE